MRVLRLLLSFLLIVPSCSRLIIAEPPLEELSAHRIAFLDKRGEVDAQCSATAIGPHAFMTAAHCNDADQPDVQVRIDLSTRRFNLIFVTDDHRDHVIYLTDATFTNYINVKERPAVTNEAVHIWGCGGGEFPPRELSGKSLRSNDKSDIDKADNIEEYSLHVIPGDSGSAIYANDGSIVALITYSHTTWFGYHHTAKGFGLAFTADQLRAAQDF